MLISLKNNSAAAVIDTLGAQLISLKDRNEKEYMWQRDPSFWDRTSPVLFPAIGNSRGQKTIFDGQYYELARHGFARDMEFQIKKQTKDTVSLEMKATEETKRSYPYEFRFAMKYKLAESGIEIEYEVENLDSKTMYYCIGAHPGFNCPLEAGEHFEDYRLCFEKEEDCQAVVYDLEKMEFDRKSPGYHIDHTRIVPLKYELFDRNAVYFESLKSKKVSLIHGSDQKGVEVSFEDFASVAFWTPEGKKAPFLCIEPWNGSAICSDEDDEFAHKHDVQKLGLGEKKLYGLGIRILEGK